MPITLSTALVNGFMCVNQELIIPRLAGVLAPGRDSLFKGAIEIEPLTDPSSGVYIDGQKLSLNPQMIKHAEFVLPAPRGRPGDDDGPAGEAAYYRHDGTSIRGLAVSATLRRRPIREARPSRPRGAQNSCTRSRGIRRRSSS